MSIGLLFAIHEFMIQKDEGLDFLGYSVNNE